VKGKLTTGRPGSEPGTSGTAVAVFLAAAIAVLLAVRWLARLYGLQLAGVAAAAAMVLSGWWAVRPQRRLPRHRVRVRLRLHPGPGHATLFELWLRWGPGAAARRARRAPAVPVMADAAAAPVADLGPDRPRPVSPGAAGAG
jgi:hypothetical protein